MCGSGISWAICKSVVCPRQKTTPAPHHSVFIQARCPSCRPTNSIKALKTITQVKLLNSTFSKEMEDFAGAFRLEKNTGVLKSVSYTITYHTPERLLWVEPVAADLSSCW